jgi:hypothetical protein
MPGPKKLNPFAQLEQMPAKFVDFCAFIGVKLTDAQMVLCMVAYDGANPRQFRKIEKYAKIADELFGGVQFFPEKCRSVAVMLCGARGGKSYVLCALRLLHLALTVNLDALAPGEWASALIVAPKLKLSRQTFRFALGAMKSVPSLALRVSNETKESFVIQRENSRVVVLECLPASRGGDAIRARYYVGAALDEFAFFRNDNFEVNDAEIFRAVTPRIIPGGQVVLASTAWARTGLMHKLFSDNFQHPATVMAARAPTILLNPSKKKEVAVEIERDEQNASREFGCEFMDALAGTFFSHDAIDKSIDKSLVLPLRPPPGAQVMIGADTGFRRDSSALVVVYLLPDKIFIVAEVLELKPKIGEPLKPSEVIMEFANACKRHGCNWLMADGHYRETLDEELAKMGLSYVPAPGGAEGKALTHMQTKTVLQQGRVRLPDHRRLIEQMKTLVGRPTSGGGMTFSFPRTTAGGHGDILSALVLALSQKSGQIVNPEEKKPLSREDFIKAETAARIQAYENRRLDALSQDKEWTGREKFAPETSAYLPRQDEPLDSEWYGAVREPWYVTH